MRPRPPGRGRARHSHPRRPLRDAYLQRATWQPGYTVVTWRGRHVAEPTELDDEEACGYWREVLRVASALQRHYRPVKMNYQTLGNAVPHLHTHLLPRFRQDPAPGRPLPFPEGERPHLPEDVLRADALALRSRNGWRPRGPRW